MSKIPVYFMPGMAASSLIFERISLDENLFDTHYLEWILPEKNETLESYAKRMSDFVLLENAVLVGVSFGGILVQEMKQFLNIKKVIIISSVKANGELPLMMKLARKTKIYKLLPYSLVHFMDKMSVVNFSKKLNKRFQLYRKFLSMNDQYYLKWSVEQILNWKRKDIDESVIHFHGSNDTVFPLKYIKKCNIIIGGSHIMIITKYKWLNENLPKYILE